jgi:hypothetical protein
MKPLQQLLAVVMAAFLVVPASALAQNDDMPDGDVDIVEKPKPKKEKKKEEKKEKKKEEAPPPKKEEPPPKKEEPPPKKEEPPPKKEKPGKKPAASDDDDILTDTGAGAVIGGAAGAGAGAAAAGAGTPPVVAPLDPDAGARVILSGDEPPMATPPVEDEPPAKPIEDAPADAPADTMPAGTGDPSSTKTIETHAEEPDDASGGYTPWIVAGAAGGGLLLLAGAGVGGFLLINALTSQPSGTVTVTPH